DALPAYMMPAHVVALEALPRTPNGKTDRPALPAPGAAVARAREAVAPRTDAERDLAAVWEEVLQVHPVGVTDNFFDLGGHSLLAAVLMGRIRSRLGHTLPLDALFTAPTVERLAAVLQRRLEAGTGRSIVPLQEEGSAPPLFLIAGVGGHVFTFHKFARLLGADQPTYGVKAIGVDGSEAPPDRVEAIAARYVREITELRPHGPYLLGGYSIGAYAALETALQLRALGHEVGLLVVFDMVAPGYPKPLPVWRRALIHAWTFARLGWRAKGNYLAARLTNLRSRVLRGLGLTAWVAPEIEGVDALPQEALKRVWAALSTAQVRYRPRGVFD